MTNYKKLILVLWCLCLCGCALSRSTVAVHDVVLLPEERIFTVPAGQMINVTLDGKNLTMTFPHPMKLVYESVLVRQEENLNKEILKTAKAEKDKTKMMGIAGSAISALAGLVWVVARRKKLKIEGSLKGEA
jgi:predicted RNA-binding protein YlqC (UPF0109 family)